MFIRCALIVASTVGCVPFQQVLHPTRATATTTATRTTTPARMSGFVRSRDSEAKPDNATVCRSVLFRKEGATFAPRCVNLHPVAAAGRFLHGKEYPTLFHCSTLSGRMGVRTGCLL